MMSAITWATSSLHAAAATLSGSNSDGGAREREKDRVEAVLECEPGQLLALTVEDQK